MATTVETYAAKAQGRTHGPSVNVSDMPELMPGANPKATPAQRVEFEQRCLKLHRDAVHEESGAAWENAAAAGAGATVSDFEAMFPALDPSLVRALIAEAPTSQLAIETLLALAAATAEPVAGSEGLPRARTPPPWNLGMEDLNKFPSLVDADGWQITSRRQIERDAEEDLGSVWRDRAKAAADKPGPKAAPPLVPTVKRRSRHKGFYSGGEPQQTETDYDFRKRIGQKRAQNRVQYGRGGRGRAGHSGGAVATGGLGATAGGDGDSASEASECEIDEGGFLTHAAAVEEER